jgi:hypothetical protein
MGYVLPRSMQDLLLDYQATAVRTLARRIVNRGGTMLGDVVGLGKTLTAIATALMLQAAEDYTTLVLCPKNLEAMWEKHLEAYGLQGARVVPYSMADKILPDLKLFKFVICDESHNLRNHTTKAHTAISEYIRRNDSKVLLLTATPYNLAFTDVANQLSLYLDDDTDLGIVPSAALAADPALSDKVDGKINTLAAFRRSESADDWRRLMSDHLVRRTRSFIKRSAQKRTETLPDGTTRTREYLTFSDGTEFYFPTREAHPLTHDFSHDDPAALMEDDHTLDAIAHLILPRYRLADYENPLASKTAEDRRILADIRSGRGNVSGFVRTGLFKRLSSSGHSFIISLQRQRARNELFIHAIDNQLALPVGGYADPASVTDEDEDAGDSPVGGTLQNRYVQMVASASPSVKWVNSIALKPSLRKDLAFDNAVITELLDSYGPWDPSRDSKVNALIDLLRTTHAGQKVLVFTEYRDTAEYVAEALTSAGVARVAVASGDDSADPADLAGRFAPVANRLPGQAVADVVIPEDHLDVLVATDVLSEGQNLQDCHVIVNFDLPWAIIRLIQRAGRVDRIGQQSDKVHVYLISHEKVEQQINLRHRIKQRLSASAQAFGSDEQFFGSEKEVHLLDDFYNGVMTEDEDTDGEADAVSEAWLAWTTAQDRYPEAAKRALTLPDLVHSTRTTYLHETRTGVACFVSTESGVDAFAHYDDATGQETLLTPLEALRVFRAEPETPTAPVRDDHFDRQAALVKGPLTVEATAAGKLRGIRKWVWERYAGSLLLPDDARPALEALHERPLTTHATAQLTNLALSRRWVDGSGLR